MAFSLKVAMTVEYRGSRSGISSRSGNQWLTLVYETEESDQISVSVPNDMISDVQSMHPIKGDMHNIIIRAVARADGNSYVMLQALPTLVGEDY